jgi:sulfate adenylyltransferase subunit 2
MELKDDVYKNRYAASGEWLPWSVSALHELFSEDTSQTIRTTERLLESSNLVPPALTMAEMVDENNSPLKLKVQQALESQSKRKRIVSVILQERVNDRGTRVLFINDGRGGRQWVYLTGDNDLQEFQHAITVLVKDRNTLLWPHGSVTSKLRALQKSLDSTRIELPEGKSTAFALGAYEAARPNYDWRSSTASSYDNEHLSNLDRLEAESISILREVVAQAENPGMLFSLGKDSCVMLHLAKKAFYPSLPPFPLIHVDTRWKFQEMYAFRDEVTQASGMETLIHINPEAIEKDINPFDHGSELHTHITKTEGLKQALDKFKIDVAIGGARRDEEKSRAKERVFSFRNASHRWDPKMQRPELWDLYNGYKKKGESIRAFPLSNWTELDIWQYIYRENIPIIPLYYADFRPVIERDGTLIMLDDDRIQLHEGDEVQIKKVRFRTLGCYPLTGAVESEADTLAAIVLELLQSNTSERQGRLIDSDSNTSMEKKKQEGYF